MSDITPKRKLAEIQAKLATRPRYRIDLEHQAVTLKVTWPCGCDAQGETLSRLQWAACEPHRGADAAVEGGIAG
jgi:hypothetical protein